LGNDAVECRARVSEALLASAESAEVLSGLGDYIIIKDEVDAARLLCEEDVSFVKHGKTNRMTTSTVGRAAEAETLDRILNIGSAM
jgi:hypothetical protein